MPSTSSAPYHAKSGGSDCTRSVRVVCGMLYFNDRGHFDEVYNCLLAAYEAHMDAFEAQWGDLSEDDYNDMADQLGFWEYPNNNYLTKMPEFPC